MSIPFARVGKEPIAVRAESGGASLEGSLVLGDFNLVAFSGKLSGKINVPCDLCAESYEAELDERIGFLISDGEFERAAGEVEEAVIEVKGAIDIKEILSAEIASFLCDYHKCPKCDIKTE